MLKYIFIFKLVSGYSPLILHIFTEGVWGSWKKIVQI